MPTLFEQPIQWFVNFLIVLDRFLGSLRCSMIIGTTFLKIVRCSLTTKRCSLAIVRRSLAIVRRSAVDVHRFLVTVTSYGTDVPYYRAA